MLHTTATTAGPTATTATAALHHHHSSNSGNPLSDNATPAQLFPPPMGDELAHLIDSPALQLLA
jgi:hypothetical protein